MDEELRSLTERLRQESGASPAFERLVATDDLDALAAVLTEPGQPLWARELAAFRLGLAEDRRAFESLVLLLNHRDPPRCASTACSPRPPGRPAVPPTPRPPPSPPTNCASPTPSTPSGCWSDSAPRRRCPP
ncbi:hypothetical protein SVIOM74S_00334 [Streptomyces violarus]